MELGTTSNKDVLLVAQNTQNIYYLAGYKYKGVTYYTVPQDGV
ncbi:MAG: hypothetical protein N2749_03860 [Clostridia bacterium]|nr:hypothetical protein [Clostridia bacterium]